MFARRFTIVCLMTIIFGFSFAILVAKASRPEPSWRTNAVVPCTMKERLVCGPAMGN